MKRQKIIGIVFNSIQDRYTGQQLDEGVIHANESGNFPTNSVFHFQNDKIQGQFKVVFKLDEERTL